MKNGRVIVLVLLLAGVSPRLFAQSQAALSGYVTDPSGAVIPGARVTAFNVATGASYAAKTNRNGLYRIPGLMSGTYRVVARADGFQTTTHLGVRLNVGEQAGLNIRLRLGAATQNVNVRTSAVHLQTQTSEQSFTIHGREIQNLAVNGRNFMTLVQLAPGAANGPTGFAGIGHFGVGVSFNGANASAGSWLVDGAENLDLGSRGNLIVSPSIDSIGQLRVQTSNYSAIYGAAGSQIVNARIKSGTNAFHGTAYEFVRNDAMDANNFFLNRAGKPRPALKLNDFGFTLGGPIIHKKVFFFYSQEWRTFRAYTVYNTHTPSPQELAGNFSAWGSRQKSSGLKKPAGVPASCISGFTISPNCINSNAAALIKANIFPAETLPFTASNYNFQNYITSVTTPESYNQELVRLDYDINPSLRLMMHFIHEGFQQTYASSLWSGDSFPTVGTHFILPTDSLAVRLTQIVDPATLNEVDFQFGYKYDRGTPVGNYARPAGYTVPTVFGNNPLNRIPHLGFSQGYGGYDVGEWPYHLNTPEWSIRDMVTQELGNQTFSYGIFYQYGIKNQPNGGDTQGAFFFNGYGTGNSFADFLLGLPNSYSELNQEVMGHWRYNQLEPFFEDDWKATRDLTLNLGLRYQYIPHAYETNNNFVTWLPQFYNPSTAPTLNAKGNIDCANGPGCDYRDGIVIAGSPATPQLGRSTTQTYYGDFAPRIGFAWELPGLRETVLRGGMGIGYWRNQGNDSYSLQAPNVINETFFFPSMNNPSGGKVNATPAPPNLRVLSQVYKPHQIVTYSLDIEHSFGANTLLSLAFVGSHGSHLGITTNINQPQVPYVDPKTGKVYDFNPQFAHGVSQNPYRPYRGFGSISLEGNNASSEYNSLQVSLERRWTHDLSFGLSYTLSHAMSNNVTPQNSYNRDIEWAQYGRPDILVFHYDYDLPFFRGQRGFLSEALGGWRWAGVTTFMSGYPFGVGLSGNHGLANRADQVVGANVVYPKTVAQWFSGPFIAPPDGYFGNTGRNILRGPAYAGWNMDFFKFFQLGEHVRMRVEADAFNIFNHVNFNNPNSSLGSEAFEQLTSTASPRNLQLGVHLTF